MPIKKNPQVLLLIDTMPIARYEGIMSFATRHGWFVELVSRSSAPENWIGDGVLVMLDALHPLRETIRHCRRHDIPVVDLMTMHPEVRLPRVIGDNRAMGELAAKHFHERGFRNIAWYSEDWSRTHELRFNGLCTKSCAYRPLRWVWSAETSARNRKNWNARRNWLAQKLISAPKPIGVFAYSDIAASVVENACRTARISVPEDVSILGVDDDPHICECQPVPLSSVRHDHFRVGWEGAALLARLMNGEKPPKKPLLIPPRGLAVRRSTDVTAIQNPLVRSAITVIRADPTRTLSCAELARQLGISRTELSGTFKKELGRSLYAEIMNQRLALACTLLNETDAKLDAVAAESGFCNASYLLNTFKRHYGITPNKWRKLNSRTP